MNKKILFIAYFYPPLGGPGVQRPLKTIKYLKKSGFSVDVLTVEDIQFHSYDHELLKESEADNIYRTNSFDLMSILKRFKKKDNNNSKIYFNTPERFKKIVRGSFPIDDKIGWFPFAYKKALELIKKNNYNFIIATIGPLTSGVLAYHLSKKTKLPFFIDYRDHMSLRTYPLYNNKILAKHSERYEKKMLRNASGVFVVGNMMKNMMISHFGDFLKKKIAVVYNGFDEDDFKENIVKEPDNIKYIRYVGNFFGARSVENFVKALEKMKQNSELPDDVKFQFIGNYFIETQNLLKSESLNDYIEIIPQQNHPKAVELIRTADLLLLFITEKERNDFVPGKVFEYIRSAVPIFSMIPTNGEVAHILRELNHKYICSLDDIPQIITFLKDFFDSDERIQVKYDEFYSRQSQTAVMIKSFTG